MMKFRADMFPVARVYLAGGGARAGWYVQRYVGESLRTSRVPVDETADAFDAVGAAAKALGCVPEQIQVEGAPWPQRRLPM